MESRREFIRKSLLLSGAAGLSTILPASIQRALAIDPKLGSSFLDAAHIVILMQRTDPLTIVLVLCKALGVLMIQGQ